MVGSPKLVLDGHGPAFSVLEEQVERIPPDRMLTLHEPELEPKLHPQEVEVLREPWGEVAALVSPSLGGRKGTEPPEPRILDRRHHRGICRIIRRHHGPLPRAQPGLVKSQDVV